MNFDLITPENLHLSTERLQLSLMTNQDFNNFAALQSEPSMMKYIGPVLSEDELKAKFDDRIKPFQQDEGHWLTLNMHDKKSNRFVGSIGFKFCSIDNQRAELGYLVLPTFAGLGYTTEAAATIIEFLFEQVNVRKIVAQCTTVNIGSWKVMEKLGMRREAELTSDFYLNDIWYDGYAYGLINPNVRQ